MRARGRSPSLDAVTAWILRASPATLAKILGLIGEQLKAHGLREPGQAVLEVARRVAAGRVLARLGPPKGPGV